MRNGGFVYSAARLLALGSAAAGAVTSGGCATMAHTVKPDGLHMRKTEHCEGVQATCPWVLGDILLLIPGIIPGVIAIAVDFGTGAWHHENLADSPSPTPAEPAPTTDSTN